MCRLLNALTALLDAKEWRTAAKSGSLGALEVFAQAARSLLTALSGMSCHSALPVALLQLKRFSEEFEKEACTSHPMWPWDSGMLRTCAMEATTQPVNGFQVHVSHD